MFIFHSSVLRPSAGATLALVFIWMLVLFGCASPGPKMVDMAYSGDPGPTASGTIGLAPFQDLRQETAKGELGHRVLNDNSREVFLVRGLDVAATLTEQTRSFLEKKGFTVVQVPQWQPDLAGLEEAKGDADRILTAQIRNFYLTAQKKGAVTEMTLTVDLSFYQGTKADKQLTTIPVSLTLERTDANFTREKVEGFFNQTLAEVLEKALTLE